MSKSSDSVRLHCSFCGKGSDELEKLISGPDVYICDGCVKECDDLVIAEERSPTKTDPQSKCSFCGKRQSQVEHILKGPKYRICDECLDLCHEILAEEGMEPWASSSTPSVRLPQYEKVDREMALDTIAGYVCGAEHWQELFRPVMEQHTISTAQAEEVIESKRREGKRVLPEDLFLGLYLLLLSNSVRPGGKS